MGFSIKRILFLLVIAGGVAGTLRAYAFEGIYIATGSMEPTLPVGTDLFLDKITYSFREPARGDIVVFPSPVPPYEKDMVKRIIGVGGDTVEIRDKQVFVNEKPLQEDYVKHSRAQERLVGDNVGPLQVPSGQIFVLGDNRDESNDSAVWKNPSTGDPIYFIPASNIRGILRGAYLK